MSIVMDEEIKRWTARRNAALVLEIIPGKATVSEASRQFDIPPSEVESWVEDGKRGMENALRANPEDVRSSTSGSRRICRRRTAKPCWNFAPEKNCSLCWARTRPDGYDPAWTVR